MLPHPAAHKAKQDASRSQVDCCERRRRHFEVIMGLSVWVRTENSMFCWAPHWWARTRPNKSCTC